MQQDTAAIHEPAAKGTADAVAEAPLPDRSSAIDWALLQRHCCNDPDLEADVLALFVTSTAALVAALPGMERREQDELAHRLKGSCGAIGALAMADAAHRLESASPQQRPNAIAAVVRAFADARQAIAERGTSETFA